MRSAPPPLPPRTALRAFRDRAEAAERLIPLLPPEVDASWLVLALPRGGVPIASALARHLGAELDVLVVRKIGTPGQPELALGAVTGSAPGDLVVNETLRRALGLTREDVERLARRPRDEVAARRRAWSGSGRGPALEGRRVLIVDDGIATGTTLDAALAAARRGGAARVGVAVPVALGRALSRLPPEVRPVLCPCPDANLPAVGAAYEVFPQVPDATVARLLAEARAKRNG